MSKPFSVNVLDYKRTFCEKLSAIARASYQSDENYTQLKDKIRHFYDIYFLMQEDEIKIFIKSNSFEQMIKNVRIDDQEQFDNSWTEVALHSAVIFNDYNKVLDSLKSFYENDFTSLVYSSNMPTIDDIKIEIAKIVDILEIKRL